MKKIMCAAVAAGMLAVGMAFADTAELGEFAKKVTFTIEYKGAEAFSDIPVVVKLSANSPKGFSYNDCAADGSDTRFADADDNAIPFEIDTWDPSGESIIWVKPPSLAKDTTFAMYYCGNPLAENNPKEVWTAYTGVWHLNGLRADTTRYSQGLYPNSTSVEGIDGHLSVVSHGGEPGKFGSSFRPNDATDYNKGNFNDGGVWVVDSGDDSPLDATNGMLTVSVWIKHQNWTKYNNDKIFYKRLNSDNTGDPNNAFLLESASTTDNNGRLLARTSSDGRSRDEKYDGPDPRKDWLHVTVAYGMNKTRCTLYENGTLIKDNMLVPLVNNNAPLVFGNTITISESETGAGSYAWNGWIDEARYLRDAKSAEWIAAEYAAMASDSFLAVGSVENIGESVVAKPTFEPEDTVFYPSISVAIGSATEGATIYYTTDGTDPTTDSLVYTSPIVITETTTVKAFATKDGMDESDVAAATYTNEGVKPPVLGDVQVKAKVTNAILSGTIADIGNNGATACDVYLAIDDGEAVKIVENATAAFTYMITNLAETTTYSYALTIRNNAEPPLEASTNGCFTTKPSVLQPGETPEETRELIQDMLDAAAAESPAGTVALGEGTFEIDVQLMLTNGVTLTGQGWEKTVLKYAGKTGQKNSRAVTINGRSTLSHMAVTGANVNDMYAAGGISISDGTISWCCVTNNLNTTGFGGGIGIVSDANDEVVKINHTIVANNAASRYQNNVGGGIGLRTGHKGNTFKVEIDSCLVYGNTVGLEGGKTGYGAGIGLMHKTITDGSTDLAYATIVIRNTTVTGNKIIGSGTGGALYTTQAKTTLENCIFADNESATPADLSIYDSGTVVADVMAKTSNCLFSAGTTAIGANSLSGDPMFKKPAKNDYHLKQSSPAVLKGMTYEGIDTDLDGRPFAATPSIGCYECQFRGLEVIIR